MNKHCSEIKLKKHRYRLQIRICYSVLGYLMTYMCVEINYNKNKNRFEISLENIGIGSIFAYTTVC